MHVVLLAVVCNFWCLRSTVVAGGEWLDGHETPLCLLGFRVCFLSSG